jgi:glycosyltransferase involved in cell wall biosynthesis
MKILFLIDSLKFGGAERQFVELIKGVSQARNIEPHVGYFEVSDDGFKAELSDFDIPLNLFERTQKYDLRLFRKLHHYVSVNNIQLLHSFSVLAGLIATAYSKFIGIPVVASTIRNSKDYSLAAYLSVRIQSFLADRFISNSRAGFSSRFNKMRKNFRIIYNGINPDRFKVSDAIIKEIENRYCLNDFDHIISMIASLTNKKDHDTLLKALPLVLNSKPNTLLLVVGDGPERERLEKKVLDLSLRKNVVFTGYLNDICAILANTHISVLMTNPKEASEGIPNCLLESMIREVPVIASRGGGTNEVIESGINGILIEPQNDQQLATCITRILNDDIMRRRFGEAGRKYVANKFGYERYINEYVELYNELIHIDD